MNESTKPFGDIEVGHEVKVFREGSPFEGMIGVVRGFDMRDGEPKAMVWLDDNPYGNLPVAFRPGELRRVVKHVKWEESSLKEGDSFMELDEPTRRASHCTHPNAVPVYFLFGSSTLHRDGTVTVRESAIVKSGKGGGARLCPDCWAVKWMGSDEWDPDALRARPARVDQPNTGLKRVRIPYMSFDTMAATLLTSDHYWDGESYMRDGENCFLLRDGDQYWTQTQYADGGIDIDLLMVDDAKKVYLGMQEWAQVEFDEAFGS